MPEAKLWRYGPSGLARLSERAVSARRRTLAAGRRYARRLLAHGARVRVPTEAFRTARVCIDRLESATPRGAVVRATASRAVARTLFFARCARSGTCLGVRRSQCGRRVELCLMPGSKNRRGDRPCASRNPFSFPVTVSIK